MKKKNILLMYASKSTGHQHVAIAINKILNKFYPEEINISMLDSSYAYPVLSPLISKFYIEIISKVPQIWDYLYNNNDIKEITQEIRDLFNFINIPKLEKLLKEYTPDIFICTHALPTNIIAYYKKNFNYNKPLICVVTDYAVHSYWINSEVNLYFVPNKESKKYLIENGIEKNKIEISGIPVAPDFLIKTDKKLARKILGISVEKFTVLIMGGSQGLGPLEEICEILMKNTTPDIQYLVVLGLNSSLLKQLRKKIKHKNNFFIYGYVENVNLFMDASDIFITKPGGVSITEAIIKNLPIIIVFPLPGQEKHNAAFLLKHKLVEKCDNIKSLWTIVYNYYKNSAKLNLYIDRLKKFTKIYSEKKLTDTIMKFIK